MHIKLENVIKDGTKTGADTKRLVQQILGLLDLQATVPEKGVMGVVTDEIAALHSKLQVDMGEKPAYEAIAELCGKSPDERSKDWIEKYPAKHRDGIAKAEASYRNLEKRIGYLMRPSTFDEIQNLDPVRDCDQIYHFVSYDFRVEQKFYANLFEGRPTLIPTGALLFHATGEFTLRALQRLTDTVLFFSNLFEWGLESHRGSQALQRVNEIHGRYSAGRDTFKYVLGNIMFVPELWNQKLGWRPFSEIEIQGWFHAYAKAGRAMNIGSIPDDREEMRQWWLDFSARNVDNTPVQRKTFTEIIIQVIAAYPAALRRFALNALLTGMDELNRNVMGFPSPPPEVTAELHEVFKIVGRYSSLLPRIPWMRSLQTFPLGGDVNRIGVSDRSKYMTALDQNAPNKGYPMGLQPLNPEEGAAAVFDQLPIYSEEELSKHTEIHSAWTAIASIIYDLTPFLYEHPGGANVLKPWLGKDATHAFEKIGHSHEARALMLNFRIGRLPNAVNRPIPITQPNSKKKRPNWESKPPVLRAEWDALLDSILSLVQEYEAKSDMPGVQAGGPVAHFPVQLPSHSRPQGVCPFPHAKPAQ